MKEQIRSFILEMGVDDAGFAAIADYNSPLSPPLTGIFPGAKSLVIMANRELDNCESENMQIAFSGRMDIAEFARSCNYKLARFIHREFGAKAMTIPPFLPAGDEFQNQGRHCRRLSPPCCRRSRSRQFWPSQPNYSPSLRQPYPLFRGDHRPRHPVRSAGTQPLH